MAKLTRLFFVVSLMLVAASFQNCAKTNFSPGNDELGSNGGPGGSGGGGGGGGSGDILAICNKNSFENVTKKLRIVLIVDNSGSTLETDPQNFRKASIQSLINRYSGKGNFSWQIISFASNSAQALVHNGSTQSPVFSNAGAAQMALNAFPSAQANAQTPYLKALQMADAAIANDPEFNSAEKPLYVLMFMSDGQPTDSSDNQIRDAERQLLSRDASRITFNSLYFGSDNHTGNMNRLREMADIGKGQFTNITKQQAVINIDDISVVPQSGCKQ